MSRVLWNYLLVIPTVFSSLLFISSVGKAVEVPASSRSTDRPQPIFTENLKIPTQEIAQKSPTSSNSTVGNPELISNSVAENLTTQLTGQITSVSQLSDVKPTDWAFQSLQSLVERYGVIAGYPDGTFKGNRALTRYEFAAGLNAALDRLNELIASNTGELVRKEDLATLQKLQEQFATELTQLRGRLDSLEARTAEVEANQFSTTTKLVGDAIFVAADTFGDRANNTPASDTEDSTNTFFSYRVRLNFQTSFTGRDQLSTMLTAGSAVPNLTSTTGTAMTRFTFDTDGREGTYLSQLYYRFPVGKNATVWVGTRALQPAIFTPTINSSVGGLNGALSRFAAFNPTIYRPGFDGAGAAFAYKFSNQLQLNFGYIVNDSQANRPDDANGFFNGNSLALGQLTYSPSRQLDVGFAYGRKYFGTRTGFNLTGGTGSAFSRNPFEQNATTSDNFGLQFNWRTSNRFHLGGWFGYTLAHQQNGSDNDATIINGALTFAFPDLGKQGNVGGLIIGVPPKVTSNDYRPRPGTARREDPDTSLHLEAFYSWRVSDNIRITPSCFVITKPEHNGANDPIWVGAVRTTFSF